MFLFKKKPPVTESAKQEAARKLYESVDAVNKNAALCKTVGLEPELNVIWVGPKSEKLYVKIVDHL